MDDNPEYFFLLAERWDMGLTYTRVQVNIWTGLLIRNYTVYMHNILMFKEIEIDYVHLTECLEMAEAHSQTNVFIQRNYIHSRKLFLSRKYINSRKSYSFKFKEICSFRETMFIQQRCVPGHSRNIYRLFNKFPQQPLYNIYKLYNYYLLNEV